MPVLRPWQLAPPDSPSQFGTFSQLGGPLSSSPTDVYPGLKSWSFTGPAT